MEPSDAGSSHPPGAKSESASAAGSRGNSDSGVRGAAVAGALDHRATAARGAAKIRRLIAGQPYFGIEAQAFHDGAQRILARVSALAPERRRIDVRTLGEDFRLDAAASWTLLQALVAGSLLRADGPASYRPSGCLREYARAPVVAPLSREHARELIGTASKLAARINADWVRNPFRIKMIAVSGSYMSRYTQLPELSLWLILNRRLEVRMRRWESPLSKGDALRQIAMKVKELSSFIAVAVVADRKDVQRPFSVVFQADDALTDSSAPAWERLRAWGASISRRLASR